MCFSLEWWENFLIWLVLAVAVIALLKLLIPWVLAQAGVDGSVIMSAINIVVWAIIAVAIIYLVFALISCVAGGGLPLMPHR